MQPPMRCSVALTARAVNALAFVVAAAFFLSVAAVQPSRPLTVQTHRARLGRSRSIVRAKPSSWPVLYRNGTSRPGLGENGSPRPDLRGNSLSQPTIGRSSSSHLAMGRHSSSPLSPPPKPAKALVYITTHLSPDHYGFLEACWPRLLARLPLFQQSDFMMFATEDEGTHINRTLIDGVFAAHGIQVHTRPNPGYQEGAILALTEGFKQGWFRDHEWLIRVNPDVLIRNDTFLLSAMDNDGVSGIFADCNDKPCPENRRCLKRRMNTDFFAIRPSAITLEDVMSATNITNAEWMATKAFSRIVRNGSDVWLPGAGPHRPHCRTRGESSPVIHAHFDSQIDVSNCNSL